MQESRDGRDGDSSNSAEARARGLLESANYVKEDGLDLLVFAHGRLAATFVQTQGSAHAKYGEGGKLLTLKVCSFHRMYWSHTGALRQMQGERVLDILGSSVCLARGKIVPVWDPRPGMTDVTLLVPLENPLGLPPQEVFKVYSTGSFEPV